MPPRAADVVILLPMLFRPTAEAVGFLSAFIAARHGVGAGRRECVVAHGTGLDVSFALEEPSVDRRAAI
jgi:hypothetical protein